MAEVTTLAGLPNDMFSSFIFPLLQHDRSTLLNLGLVSRRLKDLVLPLVSKEMETITLHLYDSPEGSDYWHGNIHVFDELVSTLNEHPYLGSYVLSLSIYDRFRLSDSTLVSLTHNLRSLNLSPPPANLSLIPSDYPYLHTLRFDFEFFRAAEGLPANEVQSILVARHFFLPSLRSFHINELCISPRLVPVLFPAQLHGTSQIESLELRSTFENHYFRDMLKCIKSLQRFIFEVGCPWECSHTGKPSLTARSLAVALKPFDHELTQLCIAASDAADFLRGSRNTFSENGPLGKGFKEYVNLRILAVPEFFLVNDRDSSSDYAVPLSEEEANESVSRFVDFVPQSIEYLQIQYMHGLQQGKDPHRKVRIRRLEELAKRKGAEGVSFGKLKKVVWWTQMFECWSNWDNCGDMYGAIGELVALKEVFYHVGVDFEFVSQPYWEDTPFGKGRFGGDGELPTPTP